VNVLDENIPESQRLLLRSWRIPVRQIGCDLGHKGMPDENVLPFLLTLRRVTFCTRDLGFYKRDNCHARYCPVCLAVGQYEAAHFIRRFLRHPQFSAQATRLGCVVRVMDTGLVCWRLRAEREVRVAWPKA
jgi:hypothetical protein